MRSRFCSVFGFVACLAAVPPCRATDCLIAQVQPPAAATRARVEIRVRDTSGAPIPGAQVSIVRGLNESLAAGTTNDRGRVALTIEATKADYEIVARKIGYQRADRFFQVTADSLSFDIALFPAAQALQPIVVTAQQDVKRKAYHLDADEIANSSAVLYDAADILAKLRPDMICGRSCRPMASAIASVQTPARRCPSLAFINPRRVCPVDNTPPVLTTNVWVNGKRIRLVAPDEMALAHQHGLLTGLSPGSMTVLSEIKPEHIAEMTYLDEFDTTVGLPGSDSALFIVLKPGVAYEPGKPSYVLARALSNAEEVRTPAPSTLPAYRHRLLGVYDTETGDPIEGADVIDLSTGTRARTTSTGTVSLVFLAEGETPVRITKPGYADLTLAVTIAPEATTPLTLVMGKQPPH